MKTRVIQQAGSHGQADVAVMVFIAKELNRRHQPERFGRQGGEQQQRQPVACHYVKQSAIFHLCRPCARWLQEALQPGVMGFLLL